MSYSITFGDQVETHTGMEIHGKLRPRGLSLKELEKIQDQLAERSIDSELFYLHHQLPEKHQANNEAGILVVKSGLKGWGIDPDALQREMEELDPDKKALMRGQVKNKRARWNLCFADFSQEPEYSEGKGTVVNFADLPFLSEVRDQISELGDFLEIGLASNLLAELNVYFDPLKCGIGFHGDTERRIVWCIRLGESNPLAYQWFHRSKTVGERMILDCIEHGDMYIMSDKAVGFDWRKTSQWTLRHSAGESYIGKEFPEWEG